jgi:hypothetical protein
MRRPGLIPNPVLVFLLYLIVFLSVFPAVKGRVVSGDADFAPFYGAATLVREGNAPSLYDYRTQADVQQRYISRPNPLPFYHPPFELLLFIPLSFLPYLTAYFVWAVLTLALLGGTWQLLGPNLGALSARQQWLLVWAALLPVMVTLVQGQDSLLLLFLYALALRAFQGGRAFSAGCVLAFGLFKFHLVIPFVLVLALRKQGRAVVGFLAGSALVALMSLWMVGPQGAVSYAGLLFEVNQGGLDPAGAELWGVHTEMMPNARGLLFTIAAGLPQSVIFGLLGLVSLAVLLAAAWAWRPGVKSGSAETALQFSMTLVAALMVSYHLHLHDLVLLLLPFVFVVENSSALQRWWPGRRAVKLTEAALGLFTPICLLLLTIKLVSPMACFVLASGVILWFELRHLRVELREPSGHRR